VIDGLRFDGSGLVAGVVQDAGTGRVLMLGWMNAEAVEKTLTSGVVHFWSRSRNTLWMKGETSGNTLELVDAEVDCDGDAMLLQVNPAGPTCHTGATSCFDAGASDPVAAQGFAGLERLWAVIASRARDRPENSYTTTLIEGGVDAAGRKVAEEATEVLLAAKDHAAGSGPADRIVEESADLIYHLLVLLAERGVAPREVVAELRRRSR
jgi:phosphoribosyl-ATP pyrophosphohydrolase/phosphoribosyl-AMP cyclohydrolase